MVKKSYSQLLSLYVYLPALELEANFPRKLGKWPPKHPFLLQKPKYLD